MKLAFSTLGCPDFSWSEMLAMAKDCGFHGIEVRGMGEGFKNIKGNPFSKENREETIKKLQKMHLEIPCLSTGCALKYLDKADATKAEIKEYIHLANALGTPYLRILAGRNAEGKLGILVCRYSMDNNVVAPKYVTVGLAEGKFDSNVRCHLTDEFNMYTEYPVALQPDGTLLLSLTPNSFVFVEF